MRTIAIILLGMVCCVLGGDNLSYTIDTTECLYTGEIEYDQYHCAVCGETWRISKYDDENLIYTIDLVPPLGWESTTVEHEPYNVHLCDHCKERYGTQIEHTIATMLAELRAKEAPRIKAREEAARQQRLDATKRRIRELQEQIKQLEVADKD
jgi:hypothetical protein